ncbi:MAG: glycosyltransferase family 2 protein [Clostridiales bacterium]|nr:glycosyltransferase family 2 protein [Clostridiales bacterium]
MKTIDIVVPCYNEEEVIRTFYGETKKVIGNIVDCIFRFIFIDDGSKDKTLDYIKEMAREDEAVKYISFSRNFGKEAGMYAGLRYSSGDYVIVMDADLQHPPYLIHKMIKEIENGYDCCAARRIKREDNEPLRNFFSKAYYKISNKLTNLELVQGAVDYRIMSRQMVDAVLELSEVQRFSKGIFEWVGFNTKWIPYDDVDRTMGETKWSFWGLLKYGMGGITAFSIVPLRVVTGMGFIISLFAFVYIAITLIKTFIYGIEVPGYVTLLSAVLFLGGIVELSLGIIGEYIGQIYMESKDRPIYLLKQTNIDADQVREKEGKK